VARRGKKDFCLKCDTADRKKIGKGKICKVCESELAVNPYFGTWKPYTKLRPFGEFRLAFIVFLPLFFMVSFLLQMISWQVMFPVKEPLVEIL